MDIDSLMVWNDDLDDIFQQSQDYQSSPKSYAFFQLQLQSEPDNFTQNLQNSIVIPHRFHQEKQIKPNQTKAWTQQQNYAFFIHLAKYFIQNPIFQSPNHKMFFEGFFTQVSYSVGTKTRIQCKNRYQYIKQKALRNNTQSKKDRDIKSAKYRLVRVKQQVKKYLGGRPETQAKQIMGLLVSQSQCSLQQIEKIASEDIKDLKQSLKQLEILEQQINLCEKYKKQRQLHQSD